MTGPPNGVSALTRSSRHTEYMADALAQARLALGRTAPNPAVGALVVAADDRVVGCGHTLPPGRPHAEVVALRQAGEAARGGALYVSLEPCCHQGRTPPCTDAILASGIRTVYAATIDPFAAVNGGGVERLRAAGLEVHVGLREGEARELNEGFFKRVGTGYPFVVAKYAMTLDGRTATRTGHSRWISGEQARRHVHRTRDRVDAILVGSGTVLADDPQLTTRLPEEDAGWGGPHHPLRVVLDGSGRMPPTARMLDGDTPGNTLIATTELAPETRRRQWEARGAEVLVFGHGETRVPLRPLLSELGCRGLNTVLVEGGGEVLYGFFAGGLVDRVQAYVAPKLVGGRTAPGPLGGEGMASMARAWKLRDLGVERFGDDLLVDGYIEYADKDG